MYVNRRVLSERNPMKKILRMIHAWVRGILSSRKCGPSSPSPCPWIRTYHVEYPSERWIVFSLSMDTDGFAMVNYTPFRRTRSSIAVFFLSLWGEIMNPSKHLFCCTRNMGSMGSMGSMVPPRVACIIPNLKRVWWDLGCWHCSGSDTYSDHVTGGSSRPKQKKLLDPI